MIKNLFLLFNIFIILVYQFLAGDEVTIVQNVPEKVNAGEEFVVEITINKGSVSGFAKLQYELPAGFTATELENYEGSFSFSEQKASFIWMSLPKDPSFKVSYKIRTSPDMAGTKVFAGKFSYIENNEKKAVLIPVSDVTIINPKIQPEPGAMPDTSDIARADTSISPTQALPMDTALQKLPEPVIIPDAATTATRTITPDPADPNAHIVEIEINKGNIAGFAKIEETIPEGFTASGLQTNGGVFSFSEQKAKILWMSIPQEQKFKVSYKIIVPAGSTGNNNIDGVLAYLENEETKKVVVTGAILTLDKEQVTAGIPIDTGVTAISPELKTEPETTVAAENGAVEKTPEAIIPEAPAAGVTGKIDYKVQIAALKKAVNVEIFKTAYKVKEEISAETHEGWNKYTVGLFNEYKKARDHRVNTTENTKIKGPFVTAYNDGKRITVQEALMITQQKWYK